MGDGKDRDHHRQAEKKLPMCSSPARPEQKPLRLVTRSTRRPHPDGRTPCLTLSRDPFFSRTGSADIAPGFSWWGRGCPGPLGPSRRCLGCGDQVSSPTKPPSGTEAVSHQSRVRQHTGSVRPEHIPEVSPALEDQGRFQPPLKRLYFPYISEDFLTFSITGTCRH